MRQGWSYWRVSYLFLLAPSGAIGFAASPDPLVPAQSIVLQKSAITISYNPQHKQADWVFYALGANELRDCYDRQNNFRVDPTLPANIASQLSDYSGSGYDRGHLSPAGDNKWSREAMSESFFLSNISPQPPRFNQGIWGRLENLVRAWGLKMGGLWVATGPILRDGLKTIGGNRVSVPDAYFKAIVTQDFQHGIGLELPTNANGNLSSYGMSIQQLEHDSGLDFFNGIPNEREVESDYSPALWDYQARFQYNPCNKQNPGNISEWFQKW